MRMAPPRARTTMCCHNRANCNTVMHLALAAECVYPHAPSFIPPPTAAANALSILMPRRLLCSAVPNAIAAGTYLLALR